MPYASAAQRRFFHSKGAAKAGLSATEVAKFDEESKGQKNLPEHVKASSKKKKRLPVNPHNKIKV